MIDLTKTMYGDGKVLDFYDDYDTRLDKYISITKISKQCCQAQVQVQVPGQVQVRSQVSSKRSKD